MQISRRRVMGILGAVLAPSVPVAAAQMLPPTKAVGPILLERVCDYGKSELSYGDICCIERDWMEAHPGAGRKLWGCGTRFRWYFGSFCYCPYCGHQYIFTLEMLKSGKYNVPA